MDKFSKDKKQAGSIVSEIENHISESKKSCGIIMPISKTEGYSETHWEEVKAIITKTLDDVYDVSLVSEESSIGIIHRRIVNNIYKNDIIICDVSSKNPNVMFELGLRLAFDKPVIIIKDELTTFSFDTFVIEHLIYPGDLNYIKMEEFMKILKFKTSETLKKSIDDPSYSPFLQHFSSTVIKKTIKEENIPQLEYIQGDLRRINRDLGSIRTLIKLIESSLNKDMKDNGIPIMTADNTVYLHHDNGIKVKTKPSPKMENLLLRNTVASGNMCKK